MPSSSSVAQQPSTGSPGTGNGWAISSSAVESESLPNRRRQPAVPIAVCFAVGVALDRWISLSWSTWLAIGAVCAVCWLNGLWRRQRWLSAVCLLACCIGVGGARHHQFWSIARPNDISTFAADEPKLVRLTGRVVSQPWIRPTEDDDGSLSLPRSDKSICLLECRFLETAGGRIPVSGRARLTVIGHLLHVQVGDDVRIQGWLSLPRRPGNPGEFDFREFLRSRGCRCVLYANHPEAVSKLGTARGYWFRRWIARLRDEGEFLFVKHLGRSRISVASALLLGDRSAMTPDVRATFAESGTMHILAISGLHVGILAAFFWGLCRVLNLSVQTSAAVVITAVIAYALITNGRPPVIRASLFVFVAAIGRIWYQQTSLENALAISAVLVLAWNPSDLFDVGAQLSFLAVLGIIVAQSWRFRFWTDQVQFVHLGAEKPGRGRQLLRAGGRWIGEGYLLVIAIWIFTLPLVAARFHLISPVGLLINVLLIPAVCLVLWLGYAFLFCGFLIPPAASLFGFALDAGLRFLLGIVEWAAGLNLGHLYVPGPAGWWLVGYYVLLALLVAAPRWPRSRRLIWRGLLAWTVCGLSVGLLAESTSSDLRCTVLDMGHGCSVFVEFPNGKVLLYDAGTLPSGIRAQRTVEAAIWHRRRSRIDAVVVSHADIDHFNAVPGLMRTVPVGSVVVAQSFLDFQQPAVVTLCKTADEENVPIRLVQRGDRLAIDGSTHVRVLLPDGGQRFDTDNANSIVLLIEYAGRTILLAGDLEGAGLRRLLETPSEKIDVLLSPHHGSLKANPPELVDWANPKWLIVSGHDDRVLPALQKVYRSTTQIISTHSHGAVTFVIDSRGKLRVSAVRRPRPH